MAGPRPVVLSGPSGAGKSTLLKKLMKEYNNVFGFSVSRKCDKLFLKCSDLFVQLLIDRVHQNLWVIKANASICA